MDLNTITVVLGLTVPFFVLTIWAFVNAAQKNFGSMGKKVFWVLLTLIPYIGAILYFIFGARRGKKSENFL